MLIRDFYINFIRRATSSFFAGSRDRYQRCVRSLTEKLGTQMAPYHTRLLHKATQGFLKHEFKRTSTGRHHRTRDENAIYF